MYCARWASSATIFRYRHRESGTGFDQSRHFIKGDGSDDIYPSPSRTKAQRCDLGARNTAQPAGLLLHSFYYIHRIHTPLLTKARCSQAVTAVWRFGVDLFSQPLAPSGTAPPMDSPVQISGPEDQSGWVLRNDLSDELYFGGQDAHAIRCLRWPSHTACSVDQSLYSAEIPTQRPGGKNFLYFKKPLLFVELTGEELSYIAVF